jgi:hypothetical protein
MQAPKDPIEQLLANTHQHCLATHHMVLTQITYSGFIHSPSIILTSIGHPKFDQILNLPCGMTNDVSAECCITKLNKNICFMYIVNLRFFW